MNKNNIPAPKRYPPPVNKTLLKAKIKNFDRYQTLLNQAVTNIKELQEFKMELEFQEPSLSTDKEV